MVRRDKENYYLDIAQTVAERGTCLRRNFGAIIVKNDQIMSTGYAGAPRGRKNCSDLGFCLRGKDANPPGRTVRALPFRPRRGQCHHPRLPRGYDRGNPLFSGRGRPYRDLVSDANPCAMCKRLIINAGISRVVIRNTSDSFTAAYVQEWIEQDGSLNGECGY